MNIFKMKVIILLVALWAILPGCKKSNGAPPAMTATIGDTTYQFTSVANFHTVIDSIFAFNMERKQSADSSYIFLEFRGAFQLNVPIDSYDRFVIFEYGNFGPTFYSAGSGTLGGHMVITVTAWDSTQHTIAGNFAGSAIPDSIAVSGKFNTTYTDN